MNTRLEIAARLLSTEVYSEDNLVDPCEFVLQVADALIAKEAATRPPEILAGVDGECIRVRITSAEYELIRRVKDPVMALKVLESRGGMLKMVDKPEVKP